MPNYALTTCLVQPIVNLAKINPSKMISPVDPDMTGLQEIIKKELTQAKTYSPPGKFDEEGLNKHLLNYVKENLLEEMVKISVGHMHFLSSKF